MSRWRRRLCRPLRALQPLSSRRDGAWVLACHLVGGGTGSPVDLPRERFRDQVAWLAEAARVVSLDQAVAECAAGCPAADPRPTVALTFDDAFRNFTEVAWPLLADNRLPATLYVPVGFLDGTSASPLTGAEALPAADWDELRELASEPGLDFGSHSWTHPDLRSVPAAGLRREIEDSRQRIEDRLGVRADRFCFPRALWSPALSRRVAATYHSAAIAGGTCLAPGRVDLHRLPRLPLRTDSPADLGRLLARRSWFEERAVSRARLWLRPADPP